MCHLLIGPPLVFCTLLANRSADCEYLNMAEDDLFKSFSLCLNFKVVAILTSTLLPTVALNIESRPPMSFPVFTVTVY